MALHPREFAWSSDPCYAYRRKRLFWVAYDVVLDAWQGGMGRKDPDSAYSRHVQQGIESPPESPYEKGAHGWLLGSQAFVDRIRQQMKSR